MSRKPTEAKIVTGPLFSAITVDPEGIPGNRNQGRKMAPGHYTIYGLQTLNQLLDKIGTKRCRALLKLNGELVSAKEGSPNLDTPGHAQLTADKATPDSAWAIWGGTFAFNEKRELCYIDDKTGDFESKELWDRTAHVFAILFALNVPFSKDFIIKKEGGLGEAFKPDLARVRQEVGMAGLLTPQKIAEYIKANTTRLTVYSYSSSVESRSRLGLLGDDESKEVSPSPSLYASFADDSPTKLRAPAKPAAVFSVKGKRPDIFKDDDGPDHSPMKFGAQQAFQQRLKGTLSPLSFDQACDVDEMLEESDGSEHSASHSF